MSRDRKAVDGGKPPLSWKRCLASKHLVESTCCHDSWLTAVAQEMVLSATGLGSVEGFLFRKRRREWEKPGRLVAERLAHYGTCALVMNVESSRVTSQQRTTSLVIIRFISFHHPHQRFSVILTSFGSFQQIHSDV